jgi:hypothetical protein
MSSWSSTNEVVIDSRVRKEAIESLEREYIGDAALVRVEAGARSRTVEPPQSLVSAPSTRGNGRRKRS